MKPVPAAQPSISKLIFINQQYLGQVIDLLTELNDDTFVQTDDAYYPSGIGDHIRHIIEHYQLFIQGAAQKSIDYDARKRDSRVSNDRHYAISTVRQVQDALNNLPQHSDILRIKMMTSSDSTLNEPCSESSMARELQYLQAHTIHHFALIAIILKLQGIEPDSKFGVAPSTISHLQSQFA